MRKFSVFSVLSLLCLFFSGSLLAQGPYQLRDNQYQDIRLCGPVPQLFTDDGGPSNPYSANLNDSISFYSALGINGVVEVTFNDFVFRTGDTLYLYSFGSGNRTLVAALHENESAKRGKPFKFYSLPGDSALTFVMVTNAGVPKSFGFNATVREASAPSNIDLLSVTGGPFINDGDSVFKVCSITTLNYDAINNAPGSTVTYFASGAPTTPLVYNYSPDPTRFTYSWISNDGNLPVDTQMWSQNYGLGSVKYTLVVVTDNCIQYDTTFRVNVSVEPNFAGTSGDQVICESEDVQITGNATRSTGGNAMEVLDTLILRL